MSQSQATALKRAQLSLIDALNDLPLQDVREALAQTGQLVADNVPLGPIDPFQEDTCDGC